MDQAAVIGIRCYIAVFVLGSPGVAGAHPVHEVVQNAYVTLTPGAVVLQLELTAGPKVAGTIIRALDTNHDKRVSQAEARAYALRVLSSSTLQIERRPLDLRLIAVDVPPYAALLGAHVTIRITARAARIDRSGTARLSYRNRYTPAESRCDANVFLKSSGTVRYQVASQIRGRDGRAITVRYLTLGH